MHRRTALVCLLLLLLARPSETLARERHSVFVSILPQHYFVKRLGGAFLDIEVMVQPGANPATYEPKPSQMQQLAASRAYFAIGVPFESTWLDRMSGVNPSMPVIHTDEGIEKRSLPAHFHDESDNHGRTPESGLDPHIWLAPPLVIRQVRTSAAALIELFPEQKTLISENLETFVREIETLDGELHDLLEDKRGLSFIVFHPSWGYFAAEYGLVQVAAEIEGKAPKPAQLGQLIDFARQQGIRIVFAQPQFSRKSARLIAREIGGEVITIDPLAPDWFANMKTVAAQLRDALR